MLSKSKKIQKKTQTEPFSLCSAFKKYDFDELAIFHAPLSPYVSFSPQGVSTIDWKDPQALKELTKAILLYKFHLKFWDIPSNFLCPTVPSRVSYVEWIHGLLHEKNKDNKLKMDSTGRNEEQIIKIKEEDDKKQQNKNISCKERNIIINSNNENSNKSNNEEKNNSNNEKNNKSKKEEKNQNLNIMNSKQDEKNNDLNNEKNNKSNKEEKNKNLNIMNSKKDEKNNDLNNEKNNKSNKEEKNKNLNIINSNKDEKKKELNNEKNNKSNNKHFNKEENNSSNEINHQSQKNMTTEQDEYTTNEKGLHKVDLHRQKDENPKLQTKFIKEKKDTGNMITEEEEQKLTKVRCIKGLDIGTGASLIYPILGYKMFGWHFVASEKNKEALKSALKIQKNNDFQPFIEIREAITGIFKGIINKNEDFFDFSMCNPPFFESLDEQKSVSWRTCEIKEFEGEFEGGELEFMKKSFEESLEFKENVGVFTSLVGRKKDFELFLDFLDKRKNDEKFEIESKTLYMGKNARWVVAWRFLR